MVKVNLCGPKAWRIWAVGEISKENYVNPKMVFFFYRILYFQLFSLFSFCGSKMR